VTQFFSWGRTCNQVCKTEDSSKAKAKEKENDKSNQIELMQMQFEAMKQEQNGTNKQPVMNHGAIENETCLPLF